MPKTKTKPTPARTRGMPRKAIQAPDKPVGQAYADALRTICELATDALSTRAEDEAAREALEAWVPEFHSQEEMDAWWDAQEKVDADVDPRLLESVKTSIRFSRMTIDGYNYLAEKMGLRSGQTLMKIVLGNYLAKHLPEDF